MIWEKCDVGCSVVQLYGLASYEIWANDNYRYEDEDNSGHSVYTKSGLRELVHEMKCSTAGICIFTDNVALGNGGKLAKYLRNEGFRVDETPAYLNPGHKSKCKMWTWYFQRRIKKATKSGTRTTVRGKAVPKEKSATKSRIAGLA